MVTIDLLALGQRVHAVHQAAGYRGRMGEQRHALAPQGCAEHGFVEKAVDAKKRLHARSLLKRQYKASRVMKIRLVCRVMERPVTELVGAVLENGAQAQAQVIAGGQIDLCLKLQSVLLPVRANSRWSDGGAFRFAAVAFESVMCPGATGGKIVFRIPRLPRDGDESLQAAMLPEPILANGRSGGWDAQCFQITLQRVAE